jgi:membrane protease YdiL (CAAX protease family)
VWWEVAAVLAVGVVPNLSGAVVNLFDPVPPPPYWLDAFHLIVLSGCTVLVTLYLIGRSGEPWERFGIVRPSLLDMVLGPFMLGVALCVLFVLPRLPDSDVRPTNLFPRPRGAIDYTLMVVKFAVAACAEELVTRAYLITRLTELLRSRGEAVLCAALLFASYHAYQGVVGVVYSFAFGLAYGVAFLGIGRVWPLVIGHALYNVHAELLAG